MINPPWLLIPWAESPEKFSNKDFSKKKDTNLKTLQINPKENRSHFPISTSGQTQKDTQIVGPV